MTNITSFNQRHPFARRVGRSLKKLKFDEACAYLIDLFDNFILIRRDEALRRRQMNDATQRGNTILQRSTHVLHTHTTQANSASYPQLHYSRSHRVNDHFQREYGS